jgi:hypothetical protein
LLILPFCRWCVCVPSKQLHAPKVASSYLKRAMNVILDEARLTESVTRGTFISDNLFPSIVHPH